MRPPAQTKENQDYLKKYNFSTQNRLTWAMNPFEMRPSIEVEASS
jgi:hypothetical protein